MYIESATRMDGGDEVMSACVLFFVGMEGHNEIILANGPPIVNHFPPPQ